MITENLYNSILLQPSERHNELLIVSGYATAAMSFHHLNQLRELSRMTRIHLIVGMSKRDGIDLVNHNTFIQLMNEDFKDSFFCSYVHIDKPVHSKLYLWCTDKKPESAFIGSANYTQTAFYEIHKEILAGCDPQNALDYFNEIEANTIFCNAHDIENHIPIYKAKKSMIFRGEASSANQEVIDEDIVKGLPHVSVELTDRSGQVQNSAGLNWGHRSTPGYNRNPNEAYIQLRPEAYRSDFFPKRGKHFTVQTDDNKHFVCTRAQKTEEGTAIETPHNNSLLGEYFRNRLGLANGEFVTVNHLQQYGRTTVDFYKVDEETYLMDFSKPE